MPDDRSQRVLELINQIKPLLRDDEFVGIMTANFDTFILVPDEVRRRSETNKTTPADTLTGLMLAHNMNAIILKMHAESIQRNANKMIDGPRTKVVGMDGKPFDPSKIQ